MKKGASVKKFRACSDQDIADAVLNLADVMLKSCAGNEELMSVFIALAVEGWNLSLFPSDNYTDAIETKLPKSLQGENKAIFKAYMEQLIAGKQTQFSDMMKGITEHSVTLRAQIKHPVLNRQVKQTKLNGLFCH